MKPLSIYTSKDLPTQSGLQRLLLLCGVLSSVLYVFVNVLTAILYEGYSPASQTVSELSAIGAPTRALWVALMMPYTLLVIAFGWGVYLTAANKALRIVGIILIADAVIGLFWPPMHQRAVLAAGGGSLTDTLHIAFTMVTVPLMMLAIVFGAAALGIRFRVYSIVTLAVLIAAGILAGIDGPKISKDLPTPWIGVWERINIGVYMLWLAVLSILLLQREKRFPISTPRNLV